MMLFTRNVRDGEIEVSYMNHDGEEYRFRGKWLINDPILGLVEYRVEIEARSETWKSKTEYWAYMKILKIKRGRLDNNKMLDEITFDREIRSMNNKKTRLIYERLKNYYEALQHQYVYQTLGGK